jgi:predicted ATP-grasp superfamily ATP-dependent carboligase
MVSIHPDLKSPLIGLQMPFWDQIMELAVSCHEMTELGYLGVDLMIDEKIGPLMIEVNARPGLAIQMANGVGLMNRLEPVVSRHMSHPNESRSERIAFSQKMFSAKNESVPAA